MRFVSRISFGIALALSVSACASDATFTGPGGMAPNPRQLAADTSSCESFWPLVGGVFVGAALGAAQGAMIGASTGTADAGAIIGAGAGGVIGLIAGGIDSATGDGYERCMAGKGYVQQVETATAPEAPPPVETAARVMTPPPLDDPAR